MLITTDGFTVQPLEFPGGDIGSLAVHGTVNDLAVAGATPLYLSLNAFIEEGLEFAQLDRLIASMARAAEELRRARRGRRHQGPAPRRRRRPLSCDHRDRHSAARVCGSASIGSATATWCWSAARSATTARRCCWRARNFGLKGDLASDAASVLPLAQALVGLPGLRFMRDPTRGGLVTVMHDIAHATGLTVRLDETAIPVHPPVRGVCEMLGYDPLYLACEGRVVAVLSADDAPRALAAWRALPGGEAAAIIGRSTMEARARKSCCRPISAANGCSKNLRTIRCREFAEPASGREIRLSGQLSSRGS